MPLDRDTAIGGARDRFPSTRRSLIEAITGRDRASREIAFETLVTLYWKPLYRVARLRWMKSNEDAKDLTQSFLARLLEGDSLASYRPEKGSFRTFIRTLFERFAANEHKSSQRLKRGGGILELDFETAESELEHRSSGETISPEEEFHREWRRGIFALAVQRLQDDCSDRRFAIFEAYDLGDERVDYRTLADRFSVPATTVTNELAAARRRFRQILLDTIREVTATDAEFRTEVKSLLGGEP